ncbi:unnamed protein product [Mytilus edulis]|uniref:Uncharacterized protein n=1 Tax=Mytilus edulis TaxID=6550 RepID=A0A8S3S2T1_MYTED|nr:unnamed protein product [Mytilus edulis]
MLDDLNIPRTRNNPDKVVNCYGRKFLEFCKNNKVFILNGRVGQDVIGRPTSRSNSVIDYIICTSHFLRCVSNFEILEFSKLFSDVHSPLKLSFNRVNPTFELLTTELSYQEENKIGKWKFEQVNDFKNNIDEDKIRNVIDELSVYSNKENVTKYEINTAVTNITDILIDSAKATFGTQTFNRNMLNCNKSIINNENLARFGSASQSSQYGSAGPQNAVNLPISNEWGYTKCTHTSPNETQAWWMFNISYGIVFIADITIYYRKHCCQKTFWGPNCTKSCKETCIDQHCYPGNGLCVWGCNTKHCLNRCDKNTAICTYGCKEKRAGLYCNKYNIATDALVSQNPTGTKTSKFCNRWR